MKQLLVTFSHAHRHQTPRISKVSGTCSTIDFAADLLYMEVEVA